MQIHIYTCSLQDVQVSHVAGIKVRDLTLTNLVE